MEINGENGSMTLYDRNGTPAAYIDSDGEHIYLFDGKPAAYLNEDAVYGLGAPSMDGLRRGGSGTWMDTASCLRMRPGPRDRQSLHAMRRRPNGPGQPDR